MPRRKGRGGRSRRASLQFSFRVVRKDGAKITAREVMATLAYFLDNKAEPDNYRIEATDWSRTAGRSSYEGSPHSAREARDAMLNNFWYVLKAQGLQGLRLGRTR